MPDKKKVLKKKVSCGYFSNCRIYMALVMDMKHSVKKLIGPASSIVAACLTLAVFTAIGVLQQAAETSSGERQLPIYCVQTEQKKIALTFDAAWGNSDTDELLSILAQNDAKATFFTTGEWVDKYPEDVKKLFDAGHEIQNHSDTHPHPTNLSFEQLVNDTNACDEKIYAITGVYPTLYRAPYGEYDNNVIQTIKSMGKNVIQWDVDSIDWDEASVDEIVDRVLSKTENGSILLFHNDIENTPEALSQILPKLKQDGYSITTVSDLIPSGSFSLDYEGRLIPSESEAEDESGVENESGLESESEQDKNYANAKDPFTCTTSSEQTGESSSESAPSDSSSSNAAASASGNVNDPFASAATSGQTDNNSSSNSAETDQTVSSSANS